MKRKYKWLLLVFLSLLVLVGWGKKNVELLSSKKLIDLDAAIQICMPGADSSEQENGDKTEKPMTSTVTPKPTAKPTSTPKPTATPRPTATPKPTEAPKPRAIVISVRDRQVTYASTGLEDLDILKERILQDNDALVTFRLVDDFAEAHVYRKIIGVLEELEAEAGIRYIKD